MNIDKVLKRSFYSPDNPIYLSGDWRKIKKLLKQNQIDVSEKKLKGFLDEQSIYTRMKPKSRHHGRNHFLLDHPNMIFEIDLMQLSKQSSAQNDNYRYLFGAIDLFSRFVYVIPLKSKTSKQILMALEQIIDTDDGRRNPDGSKMAIISSDRAPEFQTSEVKSLLKRHKIKQKLIYSTLESKAAFIERFWRTLRQMIARYLYVAQSQRFIDYLPNIVYHYNFKMRHRAHGFTPGMISPKNTIEAYRNIKTYHAKQPVDNQKIFYKNDFVRVRVKTVVDFLKLSEKPKFSKEIYKIQTVFNSVPYKTYSLVTIHGEPVKGRFYAFDLIEANLVKETPMKISKFDLMKNNRENRRIEAITLDKKKGFYVVDKLKDQLKHLNSLDVLQSLLYSKRKSK